MNDRCANCDHPKSEHWNVEPNKSFRLSAPQHGCPRYVSKAHAKAMRELVRP